MEEEVVGADTKQRVLPYGDKYLGTDVPCFIEYKLECCAVGTGTPGVSVAHGFRGNAGDDGAIQDRLEGAYISACTRALLACGQSIRVPIPPDLAGKTFQDLNAAWQGPVYRVCIPAGAVVDIYARVWSKRSACNWSSL